MEASCAPWISGVRSNDDDLPCTRKHERFEDNPSITISVEGSCVRP
jgi:hypothetical protein